MGLMAPAYIFLGAAPIAIPLSIIFGVLVIGIVTLAARVIGL